MTSRSPLLGEVIRDAIEHRLSRMHVCLPGRVQSYDAATQTADVKPTIKDRIVNDDGEDVFELPVIPDVPVACARSGAAFVHTPVAVGDYVMLVFSERALDRWRDLGGGVEAVDAIDLRHHDLSDAIALPVSLYPAAQPLVGLSSSNLSLGFVGGSQIHVSPGALGSVLLGSSAAVAPVALATLVDARLSAFAAVLTPMGADFAALGTLVGIGATSAVAIGALLGTGWPTPSVGASKVKAI